MEYELKAPIIFERVKQLDSISVALDILTSRDTVVFNLTHVGFIKPPALIGTLILIERLTLLPAKQRPKVRIVPPSNRHVLDYIVKVHFIDALESLSPWSIPEEDQVVSSRRIRPVIPITRFSNSVEIEDIAHEMQSRFHTDFIGLTTLLQPCHVIFSELADNIIHHANSNGGFILAQQYNYVKGPMLEISIGDCGIGIKSSLLQNPQLVGSFANDREAVLMALNDGVTCLCDPYRGFGLGYVERVVRPIVDRSLTLRSGTGYAIIRGGGYTFHEECKYLPGTIAHVVLPCGN